MIGAIITIAVIAACLLTGIWAYDKIRQSNILRDLNNIWEDEDDD